MKGKLAILGAAGILSLSLGWAQRAAAQAGGATNAAGQAPAPAGNAAPQPAQGVQKVMAGLAESKSAMDRQAQALAEMEKRLAAMKEGKNQAVKPTPEEIAALEKQVAEAHKMLEKMRSEMSAAVAGVTGLAEETTAEVALDVQVKEFVFKPLVGFAKEIVGPQRELENLRAEVEKGEREIKKHDQALANLDAITNAARTAKNKALADYLTEEGKTLEARRAHLIVDKASAERQLAARLAQRRPLSEVATGVLRDTVMRRVWNLLLALGAAVGVLLLLRGFFRWVVERHILSRLGARSFATRLLEVLYYAFSAVAATVALFLVLYLSNDWFLLTLCMLAFVGLVIAGRYTLPKMYEQGKLMMNLGTAREGERLLYRNLPWLIRRIGLYCELSNPALTGGALRLSLKEMIPLASRPFAGSEAWFPTLEGDWVMLADGMLGKVTLQTPEMVHVMPKGGGLRHYATEEFLRKNPQNLSRGFRLSSTFGLDYKHAAQAQAEIPERLIAALKADIARQHGGRALRQLEVELASAATSSLDFAIMADFGGEAAEDYQALQRQVQRTCVATAAKNGWKIPYPQMVIHQEEDAAAGEKRPDDRAGR
jgi:hypothetical protein